MADTVDRATRSRIMRAIKGSGTGPELALLAALRPRFRYVQRPVDIAANVAALPGRPDVTVRIAGRQLAVFVHGCFWHGCRRHYSRPKSNVAFWRRKLEGNRRRDARVRRQLRALGWATMVVWEHENPERAADRIIGRLSRP